MLKRAVVRFISNSVISADTAGPETEVPNVLEASVRSRPTVVGAKKTYIRNARRLGMTVCRIFSLGFQLTGHESLFSSQSKVDSALCGTLFSWEDVMVDGHNEMDPRDMSYISNEGANSHLKDPLSQ
jgi:hypothetical protein